MPLSSRGGELYPVVAYGIEFSNYFVDRKGNVHSFMKDQPNILKPNFNATNGYPFVGLSFKGKKYSIRLHRLVAETFIPRPKPKHLRRKIWDMMTYSEKEYITQSYQVNHIDHDVENYSISNLEWVSASENLQKKCDFYNHNSYRKPAVMYL